MKYFIDTEFDGFGGRLLSLALVREDGIGKHWVLEDTFAYNEWVQANVIPNIAKGPTEFVLTTQDMSREIARFLKHDNDIVIVADWPDDIKYFCDVIVFGPGQCRNIKSCQFIYDRSFGDYISEVPHNAYYDALAIRDKYCATL